MPARPAIDDDDPTEAGSAAKTEAQPPIVPAPTTTRSARSHHALGRGPPRRGGRRGRPLEARHRQPEACKPAGRRSPPDRPGHDRQSASRTRRTAPASMACHSTAIARHRARRGGDRLRLQVVGVEPARPARHEAADPLQGRRVERRDDACCDAGPRPAARTSTTARSCAPFSSTSRNARWGSARGRRPGRDAERPRARAPSARRRAPVARRPDPASRRGAGPGRRPPTSRTSNSSPSQARDARARPAGPAACSRGARQSPRWAIRSAAASRPARAIGLGDRQGERERRAATLVRVDPDPAAVLLDDVAGDREPEPRAAAGLGPQPCPVDLVEPLEDPVLGGARDADAVILDRGRRPRPPAPRHRS